MAGSGKRNVLSICGVRFTRCQADGSPAPNSATGAWAQTGSIGSLKWTAQYVTGDDIAELDGCGGLAVVRKYDDRLKRMDLELDLLAISHEGRELIYDAQLLTDDGDVVGHADIVDVACGAAAAKHGVIVEAWAETWLCDVGDPDFPYQRIVFARAKFTPGDGNLQRGVNHAVLKGFASPNSEFGDGPFNDLTAAVGIDNWVRLQFDDTALPTADADGGYIATPAQT